MIYINQYNVITMATNTKHEHHAFTRDPIEKCVAIGYHGNTTFNITIYLSLSALAFDILLTSYNNSHHLSLHMIRNETTCWRCN